MVRQSGSWGLSLSSNAPPEGSWPSFRIPPGVRAVSVYQALKKKEPGYEARQWQNNKTIHF